MALPETGEASRLEVGPVEAVDEVMDVPKETPPIRRLVELATRAPSVHNTQPWLWAVAGDRVALFADRARQLVHADPDGRDLILSCGAALHHLQVAAAAYGWSTKVRRMPNPDNGGQLANISFFKAPITAETLSAFAALERRRTDRRSPTSSLVPREQLDRLLALGPVAGVSIFGVVSTQARGELLNLLAEADRQQREHPEYIDETVRWIARDDAEGIPSTSLPRRRPGHGGTASIRPQSRFPSGSLADGSPSEAEPALLAICTSSDDTASRLRAGEALSAVLLHGTTSGMAMVPLSQATEVRGTRALLQNELLSDAACPQILVQVGWAPPGHEQVALTRRRPVDDVLSDVTALLPEAGPFFTSATFA